MLELKRLGLEDKEIVKELGKKPITIDVLNTRVDTARDLVLKLYTKTKDLLKNANELQPRLRKLEDKGDENSTWFMFKSDIL